MLCTVYDEVLSFMCPWLVPAQAKARFGNVSVGTELYQWSQTAKPAARPDSTGNAVGGKMPMMSDATVPASTVRLSCSSKVIVAAKLVTKPLLVATGGEGALPVPNSCALVFA